MKKYFFPFSFLSMLFYLGSCNNSNTTKILSEDSTGPGVKSVFINGDSIHYIEMGKGDPVVFVHGALADYRTWRSQMDTFAKNHHVIAYSRRFAWPNQQTVKDSSDLSFASHVNDLVVLLQALQLKPVHLVGHSSGGLIALLTSMSHPELVRSLTLGEPPVMSLLPPPPPNAGNIFGPVTDAFLKNDEEKAVENFLTLVTNDSLYFSRLPQADREIMMTNIVEARAAAFGKDVKPNVTCDDLQKVKTPVLLLGGDKSPMFLRPIMSELERCLTNKERATLANTSHGLEFENPAGFNKAVLSFIDKH